MASPSPPGAPILGWECADTRCLGCAADRHDIEVELGRETAIERELVFAVAFALVECREIEERKLHRFLDLVGEFSSQQHP